MAPIVGVPKREPCKQCGLPVFFAERLAVDGSFYHRKCLRCARCDSQLTPGSFYETEVDGVFCCETCPDEEKKMQRLGTNNNNSGSSSNSDGNDFDDDSSGNRNSKTSAAANGMSEQQLQSSELRQSFSEKLAMFQTNGSGGLLQKSLSDEEKSKSLKRLTELYAKNAQQSSKIDEIAENSNVHASETTADSSSESSDDDENDETDEQPPELPSSAPPNTIEATPTDTQNESPQVNKPKLPPIPSKANALNKIYAKMNANGAESPIKLATAMRPRSTSQSSVELLPSPSIAVNDEQSSRCDSHSDDSQCDDSSSDRLSTPTKYPQSQKNNAANNENQDNVSTSTDNRPNTKKNHLPLDALNSLTNVTKENDAATAQRDAVRAHRLDADDDSRSNANDIKCDDMTTYITNDGHRNESSTSVNENDVEHTSQTATAADLDTNRDMDGNNANSDQTTTHNVIDKCTDGTNEIDEITLRREQHKKTSSIRDNDRPNVVRSRLSQFEALLQSNTSPRCSPRLQRRNDDIDHASKQRKKSIDTGYVVDDKLQTENNAIKHVDDAAKNENEKESEHELNAIEAEIAINQLSLNDNDVNDLQQQSASKACTDEDANGKSKPIPRQRATLNANSCLGNGDDEVVVGGVTNPPTPCKRRQKTPSTDKHQQQQQQHTSADAESSNKNESAAAADCKQNDVNYPNGLNPFGSDDEQNEAEEETAVATNAKQMDNSNPFDSSDDEIELLKDTPTRQQPPQSHKATPPKNYR